MHIDDGQAECVAELSQSGGCITAQSGGLLRVLCPAVEMGLTTAVTFFPCSSLAGPHYRQLLCEMVSVVGLGL